MKYQLKLNFYTSIKSIRRNGNVMKGKTELLASFKFFLVPTVEMLQKEIQRVCNFSSSKIV
jgi:hypothetical protein